MAYGRDEVTAKYMGRTKEGSRWVYQFENPANPQDKPIKLSAFDPKPDAKERHEAPKLEEERYYHITIEHAPTKDDPSKFHHNIAREQIASELPPQGKYLIRPADASLKVPVQKQPAEAKQPQERPAAPAQDWMSKDDYWRNKEARDLANEGKRELQNAIRENAQRRGGYAHDAAQMLAVLQQTGAIKIAASTPGSKPEGQREALKLASELHEILLQNLIDNAEVAEKKFKATLETGSPKTAKKEPLEAET